MLELKLLDSARLPLFERVDAPLSGNILLGLIGVFSVVLSVQQLPLLLKTLVLAGQF
jgi:hypothetical protein